MFEFGEKLQEVLRGIDPKTEVFVHGASFRRVLDGFEPSDNKLDYLVVSQKLARDQVRAMIIELGGNPTYSTVYLSRQAFLRSRHFTLDQGAMALDGTVAFATKQCLADIEANVIRPTIWASSQDQARREHMYSASLCGRVVRLVGQGFKSEPALAEYIKTHWSSLLGSHAFRWQATKSDVALNDPAWVPVPMFVK